MFTYKDKLVGVLIQGIMKGVNISDLSNSIEQTEINAKVNFKLKNPIGENILEKT